MGDVERRKFARGRGAVGSAAAIREAVVKDIRESSVLNKQKLIEPLDYENVVVKNKTLLHNDPQREMLLFPHDDISQSELPRRLRTIHSSVPPNAFNEAQQLLARECIKSYTSKWNVIHFKYNAYSSGFQELPKSSGPTAELPQQTFEIDLETEGKDEESALRSRHTTVVKQGWLFKGPDSTQEPSIVGFTRSFKRRYFYLKQQADNSYILEFHKDDKRTELKGSIFLDLAVDANKSSRKGKLSFEIQMQEKPFHHLFATETEAELEDWVGALKKVIQSNDSTGPHERTKDKGENDSSLSRGDSLEHSMNPELQKYARETDGLLSQQRREGRRKIFMLYPDVKKKLPSERKVDESDHESDLYKEQFGMRFVVQCNEFRLRLQANLADDGLPERLDNPEPFFLTFALYDAKGGRKISEDFHFNPNSPEIRQMIPSELLQSIGGSPSSATPGGGSSSPEFMTYLPDAKWLESQKTAIFSVTKPDVDIFLVVRVEKVLQGSISAAVDQYLRTTDQKTGTKIHKSMKQYCQRLGRYRMPFVWAARPLFRKYSVELDLTADFVVYKAESSRMCEEEIIKQLQDMRRTDKQTRLQPIQGVVLKVNVAALKTPLPCTLTSTLLMVRPQDDPASHLPTREVEEFVPENGSSSYPYTTYINHLYFHPKNLKFDTQKTFAKARNIACCVEIRDSDDESALPLKIIYGPLGSSSLFVSSATTTVLHHNTSPDFMDEVKISLPTHVHEKHHLVFTFYHVACDLNAKPTSKKGVGVETVVGYAWFPLLINGRINVGEHNIKAASNLPSGYLGHEQLGMGRGSLGPEIKWLDGGRSLFKFELLLMSTVYTKDQHLHNFFMHCQKLERLSSAGVEVDTANKLKVSFCPALFVYQVGIISFRLILQ